MSDGPVVLNVHMQAVPGREQDLKRELTALVSPTRKETGCINYFLHHDPKDPAKFMFYERFQSQDALDAHVQSEHFQKFVKLREKDDPVAQVTVEQWRPLE